MTVKSRKRLGSKRSTDPFRQDYYVIEQFPLWHCTGRFPLPSLLTPDSFHHGRNAGGFPRLFPRASKLLTARRYSAKQPEIARGYVNHEIHGGFTCRGHGSPHAYIRPRPEFKRLNGGGFPRIIDVPLPVPAPPDADLPHPMSSGRTAKFSRSSRSNTVFHGGLRGLRFRSIQCQSCRPPPPHTLPLLPSPSPTSGIIGRVSIIFRMDAGYLRSFPASMGEMHGPPARISRCVATGGRGRGAGERNSSRYPLNY